MERRAHLANLGNLPFELIVDIVKHDPITLSDFYHLGLASPRLSLLFNFDDLWRLMVAKGAFRVHNNAVVAKKNLQEKLTWRKICQYCKECSDRLKEALDDMTSSCYFLFNIPKEKMNQLISEVAHFTYCRLALVDAAHNIVTDGHLFENLTWKYYSLELMDRLLLDQKVAKWQEFIANKMDFVSLYEGALLLDEWFDTRQIQPPAPTLEDLREMVKDTLKQTNPDHQVLKADKPITSLEFHECHAVFDAIRTVMFTQLAFRQPPEGRYYSFENSLIKSLFENKEGLPITMCVVFISLANSFGIHVQPINFPHIFLTGWCPRPEADSAVYKYIDVYNGIKFYTESECRTNFPASPANFIDCKASAQEVYLRMLRNIRNATQVDLGETEFANPALLAYKLHILLKPDARQEKIELARVYMHLNIHLDEVKPMLESVKTQLGPHEAHVKRVLDGMIKSVDDHLQHKIDNDDHVRRRAEGGNVNVTFKVGQVMEHRRYHYRCVIYGWDSLCKASHEWQQTMGVQNLPYKNEQPFYHVLAADGSTRYAAQENLVEDPGSLPISNALIGKYFCKFLPPNRYEPNAKTRQLYPDDFED